MTSIDRPTQLKAYIYGLGRACGIRVVPRHHDGDPAKRVLSLARDVIAAEKSPSDAALGQHAENAAHALIALVAEDPNDPDRVAAGVEFYINERLRDVHGRTEE
jgi:hypothetical protein